MAWNESRGNVFRDFKGVDHIRTHEPVRDRPSAYAVVQRDHRILIVYPQKGLPCWEIPGGGIEEGESLEEAVTREFMEETGYAVRRIAGREPVHFTEQNFHYFDQFCNSVISVVHGELIHEIQDESKINSSPDDPNEIARVEWLLLADITEDMVHPIHWPAIRKIRADDEGD